MLEVNNSEFTDKTELQKEFSKRVRCQKRAKFFWEAWRCERDEKNEIIQLNAQEYIDQLPASFLSFDTRLSATCTGKKRYYCIRKIRKSLYSKF